MDNSAVDFNPNFCRDNENNKSNRSSVTFMFLQPSVVSGINKETECLEW